MVKKRDGKRVDTGKKKENGAPIYNWVRNDNSSTMDNGDIKNVRDDFQYIDDDIGEDLIPMRDVQMEMSKLDKITEAIDSLDNLDSKLQKKLNGINDTELYDDGRGEKYHLIKVSDDNNIINFTVRGNRPLLDDDYHYYDVKYEKPRIDFNKDNLIKAFQMEDASEEVMDNIEKQVRDYYNLEYTITKDYYGDLIDVQWESSGHTPIDGNDILLEYVNDKYDKDYDNIYEMY